MSASPFLLLSFSLGAGPVPHTAILCWTPENADFTPLLYLSFPRAGAALVLSKEASKPPSRWETMKQTSPLFQKAAELREAYDESESPVISKLRSVTEWIGSFSEENEMAQVTRRMRYLDPSFDVEGFAKDLREYIIPEVLDAYLMADKEALKLWCGEAVSLFSLLSCFSSS
jgi:hypothetical protein